MFDIIGYLCWHLDIFSYFWCHLNIFGGIWIYLVAFWPFVVASGYFLVRFGYLCFHFDICCCGVRLEGGEPAAGSANIGVFVRLCLAFVHLQRKLQEHLWNCASGKYSQLWTKWYRKNMLTQLFWSEGLHWETEHLFTTVRRPYAATFCEFHWVTICLCQHIKGDFFGINLFYEKVGQSVIDIAKYHILRCFLFIHASLHIASLGQNWAKWVGAQFPKDKIRLIGVEV